ncbi:MAG: hypothetical protein PVF45_01910 [Anaerolineae bacterium]|jgi:hypothetical protein
MSEKGRLEAELQAVESAIDKIEAEYSKGVIDLGRHLQLKTEYETRKAMLEQELGRLVAYDEDQGARDTKVEGTAASQVERRRQEERLAADAEPVQRAAQQPAPSISRPVALKKLRWLFILLMIIGWRCVELIITVSGDLPEDARSWFEYIIFFGVFGGIGGLAIGLALKMSKPSVRWKQVLTVVSSWTIAGVIGGLLVHSRLSLGVLIGGLGTGLALQMDEQPIIWKQTIAVAVGWLAGWLAGSLAGSLAGTPRQ